MRHSKPPVSNFAVLALSFLNCGSSWLLWTLRLHWDIRSGPNQLPPTILPSPLCIFISVWIFQVALKKEVLEEVPDCSRGWDAIHAEQWKADNTHRYTAALIWQDAVWGEVAINPHILSSPVASASTGGGEATSDNFFYSMDIVRKVEDILYTNTDQFTAICFFSM